MTESLIRFGSFALLFALMAGLEWRFPRRNIPAQRPARWRTHLLLAVLGVLTLKVAIPLLAVGVALWAEAEQFGVLHWLNVPYGVSILLAIIVLDLAIYAQHVATHHIPLLWRLHRVHHADQHIDVSTGIRFHPIEIALSMLFKMLCVALIGAGALAVVIFEVLLNLSAVFNHSNVRLPLGLDRVLRWFIVTPDMHRVHHSKVVSETNSNYSFFLSMWDRIFRTYRDQPSAGHAAMTIGLDEYQKDTTEALRWCLLNPFQNPQHPKK